MGKDTVASGTIGPKLAVLSGSRRQGDARRAITAKGRHDSFCSDALLHMQLPSCKRVRK